MNGSWEGSLRFRQWRNRSREEIETAGTAGSRYKWVLSKIEELLDESFCSFLIYSTISHSLSSAPLLMSSPRSSQWEMLQVLPALSGFPSGRGGRETHTHNLCLHPNIVSFLFFFFFKIMMCEIKICISKWQDLILLCISRERNLFCNLSRSWNGESGEWKHLATHKAIWVCLIFNSL